MRKKIILGAALVALAVTGISLKAAADEGMWTFDNFPAAKVRAAYGFAPDQQWLDRVRLASVRLENGCSGSVVSKSGLVLTNHHCVAGCATALSTPTHNYAEDGFLVGERRDERICPGGEASILKSIVDVTERVKAATAEVAAAAVSGARAAEIAKIENETCGEDRTRRCQVVSLYRGGQYKLHIYDRYDDVRLAFAPEMQAGFFGGDPDNFNFPRYALDMALLRLYRDGKPAVFADPLRIDPVGPNTGELVFVSGNPGSTERLLTISQLEFQRDQFLPWRIEYLSQLRGSLLNEGAKGEEEARQVNEALQGVENGLKVFRGQRAALVEPSFLAAKVAEEKLLKDALAADAGLRARYGDPFADIAALVPVQKRVFLPYQMLEVRFGAGSVLLADARALLRSATESGKPDAERLTEYKAARMAGVERGVMAEAPVSPFLERLEIAYWLEKSREYLGADHPAVKAMFGTRTPAQIATEIVASSQIADPAFRRRLWDQPSLTLASNDPAIALVRAVDQAARDARRTYEEKVSGPVSVAAEKVAALRFEVLGDSTYPDATFTLRLSYGVVTGWTDPLQGEVPPFTYASGLWTRATGAYPFNLAPSWIGKQSAIPGNTQFNFSSTNDVVGGSSGSPVLNASGRIIGLAFDGNIHSTGGSFGYDPVLNRTVSLSSQMIVASLRNIYGADKLADELLK